jgi:hypothetical protein
MIEMFPQLFHDSADTLTLYAQLSNLCERDRLSLRPQDRTPSEIRETLEGIARQIRNRDRDPFVS